AGADRASADRPRAAAVSDPAELIGSLKGHAAIVCGSASGVFDECEAAKRKLIDLGAAIMYFAVSDVGMFLPQVHHWTSGRAAEFPTWLAVRQHRFRDRQLFKVHAYGRGLRPVPDCVDYLWAPRPGVGDSGLFGALTACFMGAEP